jgi:invasion protein IalB
VFVVAPGPSENEAVRLPSDVMNAAAVTPRDGAGAIVVTRDKAWVGRGCTYDVALDDQTIAGLRTGEQVTLYADPGERIVAISIRGEGKCEPAVAQFAVEVVPHATKKVRVGANASYDLKVEVNSYGGALPQ